MDAKKKLKLAKSTKEKGTEFFKVGKFVDARDCYTQVLDNLAGETTWTDQERQERDELIHVAHLNLAACELNLGDNAKVIQHCNLALDITGASVKAYFRRAKAHQNNRHYELAIKDYQQVLRLEPNNKAAFAQMDNCQRVLENQEISELKSRMNETLELQSSLVGEYHEVELGDPSQCYRNCQKKPGHKKFIPVEELSLSHLPLKYSDKELLNILKKQVAQTVHITVTGTSSQRPEFIPGTTDKPYPFLGKHFQNMQRMGTGWVVQVRQKDHQHDQYGECPVFEILIRTAAHLVFDIEEGRQTLCHFFYDSDSTDLKKCPSVSGAVEVDVNVEHDYSILTFVTNNRFLIRSLAPVALKLYWKIRDKYRGYVDDDRKDEMSSKIEKLSKRVQRNMELLNVLQSKAQLIMAQTPSHMEYLNERCKKRGDVLDVLGMAQQYRGNNVGETCQNGIALLRATLNDLCSDLQKLYVRWRGTIMSDPAYKDFISLNVWLGNTLAEKRAEEIDRYQRFRNFNYWLECQVHLFSRFLNEKVVEDDIEPLFSETKENILAYPLTVMISHPHGGSKKITFGQAVEWQSGPSGHLCRYSYTNTTCPGCSGARVFILGRAGFWHDHPHRLTWMLPTQDTQTGLTTK